MSSKRLIVDPENKYPADGFLQVEENAQRLLTHLPGASVERTRDAIQIDYLGEEGIVILVTPKTIEFRLPTIEWTMGAYGPAASSRLWRRVDLDDLEEHDLNELIQQALETRQAEWKTCRYCGRQFPTKYRFSEDICHGCASQHHGVVY